MQHEEIHTYEIPIHLKTSSDPVEVSAQESSGLDSFRDIILKEIVSNDICLINKIGNYNLTRVLILIITYEDDLFFVENQEFNMWGEGDTLETALKSFVDFFLYDFKSYKNMPTEQMDFFARQELKLYKALLNIS